MRDKQIKQVDEASILENLRVLYDGEFKRFSPMTGTVDEDLYFGRLATVALRARKCLSGRSDYDVENIAMFSDWAITAMFKAGRLTGVNEEDGTPIEFTANDLASRVSELSLVRIVCQCFLPPDDDTFTAHVEDETTDREYHIEIKPTDVFATCALVLTARALEFSHEEWHASFGASYAIEAAEAMVLAEHAKVLIAGDSRAVDGQLKIEISQRARKAAQAKAGKLAPARNRAMAIWLSQTWPSRAEAVRRMRDEIEGLAREAGCPLSPTNAEETISGWLKSVTRKV